MVLIEDCSNNKILLAVFLPHASYTLQLLEVSTLKPLSTAYSNQVSSLLFNSQGTLGIQKQDFSRLLRSACELSSRKLTIVRSFEVTGLSPLDPDVILQKLRNWRQAGSTSNSRSETTEAMTYEEVDRRLRRIAKGNHRSRLP